MIITSKGHSRPRGIQAAVILAGLLAWLAPLICIASDLPLVTARDLQSGFSLEGQWRFQPGDDPQWASTDFDDNAWQLHDVPGRWADDGYPQQNQIAWYRLSLSLAPGALDRPEFADGLGIQIGKVLSAYEVYANGKLLGGAGKMPPLARSQYGVHKVHFLPRDIIGADGRLELAMRVWGGSTATVGYWGAGPYGGPFKLGNYSSQLLNGMSANIPSLVLCGLFLAFGLNQLYLYHRSRQLKLYLWFGLTAINIGIYSLMLTQWKFLLPLSFNALKAIEFGAVYVLPIIALQMIWALLGTTIRPWMRVYQISFFIFMFLGITNPWPDTRPLSLNVFQIWVLPVLFVIPKMLWDSMRAGNIEARTLFLGLIIFGITCINDILIDLVRLDSPRMIHYGFAVTVLAMAMSVGNRFTAMLNRLEKEVAEHTEELREANYRLSLAARVDPLTGLLNRRGFIEDAEKEVQRINRGSESFAVVLADIDHFKIINDRHGHSCGDEMLRRVAALLRQRLREIDIVGRWGGEEFIFVLPKTDAEGAEVVAEYLRLAIETANFKHEDKPLKFTMTFGIAIHHKGESLDTTIHRADTAMYQGKDAGRNQVIIEPYKGLSVIS